LGFWKALDQVYPTIRAQRCWVHKTANVLDKLPNRIQPGAKDALHQIWMAETRKDANSAFDLFLAIHGAKYPKACEYPAKDRAKLLAFYDFPAEHWKHLRTTNPIESTFATVRLRHRRTKGSGSRTACLTMVFKLMQSAAKRWRLLNGSQLLHDVIQGVQFTTDSNPNKTPPETAHPQQLTILPGVTAETLRVLMRHQDQDTTEKYYTGIKHPQTAAAEINGKMASEDQNSEFVGRFLDPTNLTSEQLKTLKSLLEAVSKLYVIAKP
jgi:hypothetical protein